MQTKTLNYNGKKIVYRTKGEGPVVMLLHGFGEDGSIWKEQYDLFPHHQLIVPDLPGSGGSETVDDMSMEGLAEVVKTIIASPNPAVEGLSNTPPSPDNQFANKSTTLESGPFRSANPPCEAVAVLIGHSMGGYITLAFAEKYPDLLCGFGLFHSSAFADSDEKKETRRKAISFIEQYGAVEFLKTATPNLYAQQSRQQHPEWIEEHLAATRNFSGAALVHYYRAMIQRPDRTAVLRNSKVPVLFVLGQHDAAVPLKDGLQQCYLPQIAYIHILEKTGHMGMTEERDAANKILTQFVNTIEKTA